MKNFCFNCGRVEDYKIIYPIDIDLQRTWGISKRLVRLFNNREGRICTGCGVNVRAQGLAKAIVKSKFGYKQESLRDWVKIANKKGLKVCELNSCHNLHDTLKKLKFLTYSEYGTTSEQNIEALTLNDNQYDIVLHSETLEHVSNPKKAMNECRRILKQGGLVLFTTPVIWGRNTKQRAKMKNHKIEYLMEPSYHGKKADDYLVYYEYGRDIDSIISSGVFYADWINQNYVFYSEKSPVKMSETTKLNLKLLEKLAGFIAY